MDGIENFPSFIGRYEIKALLGAGAMGSVYLAEDPRIKRKVAIKVVKLDSIRTESDRQEFLARFQREAEVSGLLNDPGIVTIYDVGESEAGPFLAMEYVPGRTLESLIRSGEPLSLIEKLSLAAHIASALDHAHSHNIVHRDVKPGNVMVTADHRPKLMDFGIAKREDASLTQTGTFLGTPSYASPEQIKEGVATGQSDVFSFGVMVFELLSGSLPFPGTSINTILYRIVNEPPQDIQPPVEGLLPDGWQRVFNRVLAKDPAARHASCAAFVRDLLDAAVDLGRTDRMQIMGHLPAGTSAAAPEPLPENPSASSQGTVVSRPQGGGRGVVYALAAGLAVAALAAGVLFLRKGRPGVPAAAQAAPGPVPAPAAAPAQPRPAPAAEPERPAAPAPEGPDAHAPGSLRFSGEFPVRVRLDGKDLGEVHPGAPLQAQPGNHRLELSAPRVFYKESRSVQVRPGQSASLTLPGLVRLTVETFPASALVMVDGQVTQVESDGSAPITLTKGRHAIGIQGHPGVLKTVDLQGDTPLKFKL